jgi:hypothetical protein
MTRGMCRGKTANTMRIWIMHWIRNDRELEHGRRGRLSVFRRIIGRSFSIPMYMYKTNGEFEGNLTLISAHQDSYGKNRTNRRPRHRFSREYMQRNAIVEIADSTYPVARLSVIIGEVEESADGCEVLLRSGHGTSAHLWSRSQRIGGRGSSCKADGRRAFWSCITSGDWASEIRPIFARNLCTG